MTLVEKFAQKSQERLEIEYKDLEAVKWQIQFLKSQFWYYMEQLSDPIRWTDDEEFDSADAMSQYLNWSLSDEGERLTKIYNHTLMELNEIKSRLENTNH